MDFQGNMLLWTKIILNDKPVAQVNQCNYLGCTMSYGHTVNVENKLLKFQQQIGTIKRTLNKKRKKEALKFYKVMAVPMLLYGEEERNVGRPRRGWSDQFN